MRGHRSSLWLAFLLITSAGAGGDVARAQTATFGPIVHEGQNNKPSSITKLGDP
jgi:hypothetical protein